MTEEEGAGAPERGQGLRLGEPIELPWWAPVAILPPLLSLVGGLVFGAPIGGRLIDLIASAAMIAVIVLVGTRVASRNMQSVWISAAYAIWFFVVLIWIVEVHG